MKNRADEIRKRIERRKKQRKQEHLNKLPPNRERHLMYREGERNGFPPVGGEGENTSHPLFKKEMFMFRILMAIALFLSVGILYKNQTPEWEGARQFVESTFETEFQFAAVSGWYEEMLGEPVALFPGKPDSKTGDEVEVNADPANGMYAIPASGTVLESFDANGKGIMVKTGADTKVEAVKEGTVIRIMPDDRSENGKTVILQHGDGTETWYGNLSEVNVKLYDFVEAQSPVGSVTKSEDGRSGTFYFSIKQGEEYIDPASVLPFY